MRILATAVLVAATSAGAQASSIIYIGDNDAAQRSSVAAIGDARELSRSPSLITMGPPAAAPAMQMPASAAPEPVEIAPLPVVIRAGIEGEAFSRAISPDGTGSAQVGNPQRASAAPEPGGNPDEARAPSGGSAAADTAPQQPAPMVPE